MIRARGDRRGLRNRRHTTWRSMAAGTALAKITQMGDARSPECGYAAVRWRERRRTMDLGYPNREGETGEPDIVENRNANGGRRHRTNVPVVARRGPPEPAVLSLRALPDAGRQDRGVREQGRLQRATQGGGSGNGHLRPGAARGGEGGPGLHVQDRPQGSARCGRDLPRGDGLLLPLLRGDDRVGLALVTQGCRTALGLRTL